MMLAAILVSCWPIIVVDGDTLKCNGQLMRLISDGVPNEVGVDTPELRRYKCEQERLGATAARTRLNELVATPGTTIENSGAHDRSGRPLVRIRLPDGRTAENVLLEEGPSASLDQDVSQRLVPRMSELVAAFIAELIRAANEVERLSNYERSRLLRRAARTIREYREQTGAEPSSDAIVDDLNSMADAIDLHGPKEVAAAMLDAVAAIKAGRSDLEHALDAEYEDLVEELNNPDGTT
jgi:hypothetical protein